MNRVLAESTEHILIAPLSDADEWDAFVERTAGATFCHLYGWRDIAERVMRQESCYVAAWDRDGSIRGVLPLVRLKSVAFGSRHVSVPWLNDGGAIGDREAVVALHEYAVRQAADAAGRVELRIRASQDAVPESGRKVTVLLDLPSEADALWSVLPSKVRSQVRRPQKAGMTVRFGADQLKAFYAVWSRNMRDLGTPVLPFAFFEAIADTFADRFVIGCVYQGERPVAAGAGFIFRDEFEITWASSLREYSRDAPNMLLYWEFMTSAVQRGARTFNFGRCTPGEGTHRFKLQWGGATVPLAWVTHGSDGSGPGRVARIASGVWQRLPMPVANTIGPTVARQLPWW